MFSVIIPIYKVEEYIRRCVDSVLAQTYKDFELL
ncbi:MAG: glycosyltransferase, partial [Clostridia bacterium]|nr:glycosyltransferase [Clostridia bacterium]